MHATSYLDTSQGSRIAYHKSEGPGPCVALLSGRKSDMEGT
ncbi:MAG: alpha/beta hydrolase, partial [Leisingera sp.]